MDRTKELIARAHRDDIEARDTLVDENTGLVFSIARRFLGRGQELEDLFQIGCIGLLKAIDRFDLSMEVKFSTYAVPMITGEIRRFLRDDGMIKISRSIKENASKCVKEAQILRGEYNREPTLKEIADKTKLDMADVVQAMESSYMVESIELSNEGVEASFDENVARRVTLGQVLEGLPKRDREILILRYFYDMTQVQVAKKMGISQVQVSRIEKKALGMLRIQLE